ncbi:MULTISPECIES: hypothetical protein [Pseudanabaena]|uniref:hypothetical protein n=1 Tax=Pseudanabaena TaxID=1152 RepID=UPI0024789024|nr:MULTISPECIES: hypothetical protein [Pseudanabaena]MEA5488284.1 hypothetical protein [Pseudanabaena sp. CCNP1317]WGS72888.1 hypothetical protein OA858_02350 [Pseudanabaena galeata CCNP1313]
MNHLHDPECWHDKNDSKHQTGDRTATPPILQALRLSRLVATSSSNRIASTETSMSPQEETLFLWLFIW